VEFEVYENTMNSRFSEFQDPLAVDLLRRLLALDPHERIAPDAALDHDFFWKDGATKLPKDLPMLSGDGEHEFEIKLKREREKTEQTANYRYAPRIQSSGSQRRGGMDY
jgi:serine/threonine protein kinase